MGEWIAGAAINILGSVGINLGTNLLKLGHNQREREIAGADVSEGRKTPYRKSIVQFQAWRTGLVVFFLGNCLNFISFGYAAQSLLAALGSVQFISNIAFAYFVLREVVTSRIIFATTFIVLGNAFLVAYGNHQSPVFTPEQLMSNYKNGIYLVYCAVLVLIVAVHHAAYRKGRQVVSEHATQDRTCWQILLPFCYAVVSGAIGTHSVLFAKSLSILLRLQFNGQSQVYGWFTYIVFFLFLVTAAVWMTRLNDGLAMFDAILIVPMLQISWTTFSIFTGFVYFQEYKVFDSYRASMFAIGILALFLGILLLAPPRPASNEEVQKTEHEAIPLMEDLESSQTEPILTKEKSMIRDVASNAASLVSKGKSAYKISMGFGQGRLHASSIFIMPMLSSSRSPWRAPTSYADWLPSTNELEVLVSSIPSTDS